MFRVNILRARNIRHFADDIFRFIFLNYSVLISIKISHRFIPRSPINNTPALVQIVAWPRTGHKPLFERMMIILLTYICVTLPQWVKTWWWICLKLAIYINHCHLRVIVWTQIFTERINPVPWTDFHCLLCVRTPNVIVYCRGYKATMITRFMMGPTWGPSGADRTQMGPMLALWTLLPGYVYIYIYIYI